MFNPFRRKKAEEPQNNLSSPDEWLVEALLGGLSSAGVKVSPVAAMGVSTVYACVSVISKAIASLPLCIYELGPDGDKKKALDHPMYDLLALNPAKNMTSSEVFGALISNLVLRGNAYALISRDGLGNVRQIVPIEPSDIQLLVHPVTNEIDYLIDGKKVARNRVLHLKGLSSSGVLGYDTTTLAKDTIGLSIALQDDLASFFKNGSKMGSILLSDRNLKAEQVQKLKEAFDGRHKGSGNHYKTAILTDGLKPFTERFSYQDSQLSDQKKINTQEIARTFGVPLSKLQIESAQPRANVEESNRDFVTSTLRPIVVSLEQALNLNLLSPAQRKKFSIDIDMDSLLRGNMEARYNAYRIGREMGMLNVNEIRRFEGMNGIGEKGDIHLQPLNFVELGSEPASREEVSPEEPEPQEELENEEE
jgi:HK97 family phage portal protein